MSPNFFVATFRDSDIVRRTVLVLLHFSKKLDIKKPPNFFEGFRGIVRIRTAVGAFAEPSLATRPRRHY